MTNLSSIPGFSSGGGTGGGGSSITSLCADTPTSSVQVPVHASGNTNRIFTADNSGWIEGQCTGGVLKARNTYGYWVHFSDNTSGALKQGTSITPITVDRSTGAITAGTTQDLWVNSNVSTGNVTYSTTLNYEPVHGCIVNSGLAGWDLSSATEYSYGHAYGQLEADGTVSLQASATNNASATMNSVGSRCLAMPQGTGTQYVLLPSNFSYGSHYTMEATSSGWQNVSSTTFPTPQGSAGYSTPQMHYYQPDQPTADSTLPASVINRHNFNASPPTYGYGVNHNGSFHEVAPVYNPIYGGQAEVFMRDDEPFLYYNYKTSKFTAGGGTFTLSEVGGERDKSWNHQFVTDHYAENKAIGIGGNRYLFFGYRHPSQCDYGEAVMIGVLNDYNIEQLGKFSVPGAVDSLTINPNTLTREYFTVYENDTDASPKWLIVLDKAVAKVGLQSIKAESYEITADLTAYVTSN